MPRDFFPRREAAIVQWSANFRDHILVAPADYGLTAAQASAYAITQQTFEAAYNTAISPGTNSRFAVATKNAARDALETDTRMLAAFVRATRSVTNAMRIELGLSQSIEGRGVRASLPDSPPRLYVTGQVGRSVTVKLSDSILSGRRGKPVGIAGASVFSFVGDEPPTSLTNWVFKGNTTRTTMNIAFDNQLPPGTKIWLSANWYNTRAENGPSCAPVSTYIQFGSALPDFTSMNRAA
jgi:hypothetical protein